MVVTYLGHAGFYIKSGDTRLVIDPFISENPLAKHLSISDYPCDYLLITHAHGDHIGDADSFIEQFNCKLVANFEIFTYFNEKHLGLKGHGMNIGGKIDFQHGQIRMVNAIHSSTFPDGSPGGTAGGFIIQEENAALYIAGDTALHTDMKIIPQFVAGSPVSILPIGGCFTMDADDAIVAARWTDSKLVIGCHYDTFPPIKIDHEQVKQSFKDAGIKLILMSPGEETVI